LWQVVDVIGREGRNTDQGMEGHVLREEVAEKMVKKKSASAPSLKGGEGGVKARRRQSHARHKGKRGKGDGNEERCGVSLEERGSKKNKTFWLNQSKPLQLWAKRGEKQT